MNFTISVTLGAGAGIGVVALGFVGILLWIAANPSRAERVAFWLWSALRFVSKRAETKSLATDITHRVNNFALKIGQSVAGYTPIGLSIQFTDEATTPQHFISEGKLVVRMRPRTERDYNFLAVAAIYVARSLFPSVKSHLRPNQRDALDLYTTEKLIRDQRAQLVDEFVRNWINPAVEANRKLEELIGELHEIDQGGIFLPVLAQELHLLGARMIGMANREALRKELENFTEFLVGVSRRRVGDVQTPLEYHGQFLRVALQIVSIRRRREKAGGDPGAWVRYANEHYATGGTDHVYFLGSAEDANRDFIRDVADRFCAESGWDVFCEASYEARIFDSDGQPRARSNYIVLCRSRTIQRI